MPLYALLVDEDGVEHAPMVWDSGEHTVEEGDEFELHAQCWRVRAVEPHVLDTPEGTQFVDALLCDPC